MNQDDLLKYLRSPEYLNESSLNPLVQLSKRFRYCQSLQLLLLLNLHKMKHVMFADQLKFTALCCSHREIIKSQLELLDPGNHSIKFSDEHPQAQALLSESKKEEVSLPSDKRDQHENTNDQIESHLNKASKLDQKTTGEPKLNIEEADEVTAVNVNKSTTEIIDDFIKNEPRITRPENQFFKPSDYAKSSIVDEQNIVSETLANIYRKQGHFEKAMEAYKKLGLIFPEKSAYFAALIEKTKEESTK